MTEFVALEELPEDHPLRNAPLHSIGAEYKPKNGHVWFSIDPHGLGTYKFNDLYGGWERFNIFRAPKEKA